MNSIKNVFEKKRQNGEKTNIGYVVAGYPNLEFTKKFLENLDKTSIDILEVGVPYSDPLADGKLISEASFAASEAGVTTDTVFDLINEVKEKVTKPLVFLIYYNLIWEVTKMKKFLLLAVLAVSASAFAATDAASLVGELQALDAEYQNLANQEEARFNEERAQADAARQALAQNEQVYNELSQRAQRLQAEANTRFYKSQYEDLASKYEDALKKLEAEMEQQKAVISDFEKIQALRAGN